MVNLVPARTPRAFSDNVSLYGARSENWLLCPELNSCASSGKTERIISTEKSKITFFFSVMEILISRATAAISLLDVSLCYCKITSEYYLEIRPREQEFIKVHR